MCEQRGQRGYASFSVELPILVGRELKGLGRKTDFDRPESHTAGLTSEDAQR